MLNEAQISLTGYVATQPIGRVVRTGVTTVSMRVAWTPRRRDRVTGEWADGHTSYVTVICWRKLASNVAICVRKGDPVIVQGRVTVRPYVDRENRPRIAVEIEATSVGHDLNHGVSQFSRIRPKTGMTAAEYAAAQAAANGESPDRDAFNALNGLNGSGPTDQAPIEQSPIEQGPLDQGGLDQGGLDQGGLDQVPVDHAQIGQADRGHGLSERNGDDAAASRWTDDEASIPLPDEPDQAFFDDPATFEAPSPQPETVAS